MNSDPSPALAPLTPAEEAEIAEYERIVAFAEQVMAGTHPRVKIPAHLLPVNRAITPSPPTNAPLAVTAASAIPSPDILIAPAAPSPVINFRRDYYHTLGIQEHVKQNSILRAFESKSNEYNPDSVVGRARLESGNSNKVRKIETMFKNIEEAYAILSVPELRQQYDDGRDRDRTPPNDRPIARPAGRGRGARGGRGYGGRGRGGRRG